MEGVILWVVLLGVGGFYLIYTHIRVKPKHPKLLTAREIKKLQEEAKKSEKESIHI